jgi:hypothetical protein
MAENSETKEPSGAAKMFGDFAPALSASPTTSYSATSGNAHSSPPKNAAWSRRPA